MQEELTTFEKELREAVDEIWQVPDAEAEGVTSDGWAARMQEYEKRRQVNPLEKVTKPDVKKQEWNLKFPFRC